MTHEYVWRDSFVGRTRMPHTHQACMTWPYMNESCHTYEWVKMHILMGDVTHMNEPCHTQWDMTPAYTWRDAFILVTWRVHIRDMTHPYVWHDAFICMVLLIYICDMTSSYVWHDASMMWLTCHSYECVMSHICMSHVTFWNPLTHPCAWHDSFICVMWLMEVLIWRRMSKRDIVNASFAERDIISGSFAERDLLTWRRMSRQATLGNN